MTATWDLVAEFPDTWFDVPIGPTAHPDDLDAQIDARIDREPALAPYRQALAESVLTIAADATEHQATAAKVRFDLSELDGVSHATVYVFLLDRDGTASPAATVAELEEALAGRRTADQTDPAVEVRHLDAGDALRVQVITEAEPDEDGGLLLVETVQYWLPVPGHDDLILLAFSTPNLAGADALIDEFDAIAARVKLER
ncbi:MAG: hypothetical protein ACRD0G_11390 [Acidimicrobiales bacterium]